MRSSDKFLIAIVIAIILIVVAAFAVTLTRPEETYLPDDSPENIVHNYLFALQQEDYDRAYSYLSPQMRHYPASAGVFEKNVDAYVWNFRRDQEVTLSVESGTIKEDEATVQVVETRFYGGGLFDSSQSISTFEMELVLLDRDWKISDGDAYFASCWTSTSRCK